MVALGIGIISIYVLTRMYDKELLSLKKIEVNLFHKVLISLFVFGGLIFFFQKFDFEMFFWKFQERFANTYTWDTRVIHWNAFIAYWIDNLNIINLIFGSGLDSSMNVIYQISNSMGRERGLVQVHNTYLGTIYETGIFGIMFFWGIFSTAFNSYKTIKLADADYYEKFFSSVNIGIIVFIFIQWTTVEITMPAKIVLFCAIGFTESAKFAFKQIRLNRQEENSCISPSDS
jgi:O-antigen ligase